jgi:pathogen-inducible salicylic acid glucosyltransferase
LVTQEEKSQESPFIIYVAFGSMAHLETEQLVEIARALNNYSVIWSLKTNLHIHLPSSFVENFQHLLLDWAPQRFILSHLAIRLFISRWLE